MGKKLIKMENTVIVEKFQKAAREGLRGIWVKGGNYFNSSEKNLL